MKQIKKNWTRDEQHSEAKMMTEGQKLNSAGISKDRRYPKIKTKFWKTGNRDETRLKKSEYTASLDENV